MYLSAVVVSKNEEINIETCLKSLDFCDEILVIDDYSSDKTVELAKKAGAKVFLRKLNNNFADQKNFGLEKAGGDWILFIDADEVILKSLSGEILNRIKSENCAGFKIRRIDYFLGKRLKFGETGNAASVRLVKKNRGKWHRRIHENLIVKGRVTKLKGAIIHQRTRSLSEFIKRIDYYSTLHARANYEEGKKSSLTKIILWPAGKLICNLIVKRGFLDETPGVVFALLLSFHSFLAWSKLWLWQKKIK